MVKPLKIKAIAYLRTSSSTNTGAEKDSEPRQRAAIARFARSSGYELIDSYYDAAVSGAEPLEARPGFASLLAHIAGNGVRTVIVEDATRFARDLTVQETGLAMLRSLGVTVLTSGGNSLTQTESDEGTLQRHMLGAFAQYEKANLVRRLKGARDRKRLANDLAKDGRKDVKGRGKCAGRNRIAERNGAAVALAQSLAAVRKGRPSLRRIADTLAAEGHVSASGKPFSPSVVQSMLTAQA